MNFFIVCAIIFIIKKVFRCGIFFSVSKVFYSVINFIKIKYIG